MSPYILLIEDNTADVLLVRNALASAGFTHELVTVADGEAALEFLARVEAQETLPVPALVLLDLNVPRYNGAEVLERIRASGRCATIPVIVVTSSDSPQDRQKTAGLGVSAYFRKPMEYDEFMKLGSVVAEVLSRPAD